MKTLQDVKEQYKSDTIDGRGLENFDEYPMYGLPIFKATAIKYGFENPIGEDSGSEDYYNEN